MYKVARCIPLALVGLVLMWAGPASAVSVSFIEPISPTANISATTDIAGATIVTSPESASVSVAIPLLTLPTQFSASVGLTEPGTGTGPTSTLSDLLAVSVTTTGTLTASFTSDSETPVTGSPLVRLEETGLPQVALSASLSDLVSLTITTQSDVDEGELAPVPEPSTLLLFGSSLAGVAALWRRYRHS